METTIFEKHDLALKGAVTPTAKNTAFKKTTAM